jgi:hypothetical protein
VLAHERARVEVAHIQIVELGPEMVAEITAGTGGHLAELAQPPAGLRGDFGQPLWAEHEQRGDGEHKKLARSDV